MFEIDFAEHKGASTYGLSKEDRRFLEIAEQGIHQCEDGHYELPLPLKDKRVKLPNNREAALRRLNQLKRKLLAANGAKYREDYIAFMNKVIESGYAERVPTSKEAESKVTEIVTETKDNVWYIPHHGVYHPKKPNKIRVVFDCAAEYQNESLNKHLLQGPDLTNNLTGVLYRFRQESFAFTCDIEAMFHQVKVIQEHRDLLRFLWWENGDTTKEPQEYRMTVHLFGATSSPGCANFALKSTAKDHEDEYGGAAADFLRNDFYVDDGLKSVPSVEEAIKLIKDIKGMCAKGGFNLHKFVSNSKESIFDPIGFVAPLLLEGKSILQELCRYSLGWDEPIPDDIKARWEKWRTELINLQRISIPRCYKPQDFGQVVTAELHHFSDASVKGYGQCSYLRLIDEKPENPLRLRYGVQEIQENTAASQWKYIESKRNPADEASRGMKAQDLPDSRWITGPAFLWEKEEQWPNSEQDTGQPNYELAQDDPEIKKTVVMATTATKPQVQSNTQATLAERVRYFSDWYRAKRAVALCLLYVKRLRDRVRGKQHSNEGTSELKVSDLEAAEHAIIRSVQNDAFKEELATLQKIKQQYADHNNRDFALQRNASMKSQSSLYKLDPFVDANDVLRVGGRLRRANLSDDIKFPIILPRGTHVTTLIIRHFHAWVSHQGKGMTLNEIRSNGFWVIGGSSAVANVISSCVKCQKLRGAVQEQRMSDLPEDRLQATPPFTYCGVDYFGPFLVREGRKDLKRYGVLFTCMASRAIHLETANSLETDAFINALRRFISRRGPIRQLRSDQGTNFVGARRELAQALAEMDQDKIKNKLLEDSCDWFTFKMNVPAASHMGGVWERQIRTVRNVLSSLLQSNGAQLDDESLRTLMCEVEAIVNSRPLTINQLTDPDSPSPLMPNHLLTMKTKVVLSPPGVFQSADLYCRKRWRRVQHLANEFWTRWRKEFLLNLQHRQKWTRPRRNLQVDDVVIVKEENLPRSAWQLARVSAVYPSSDGCVRKVQVAFADSCLDKR
ncbi:hypothetical protein QZH41_017459, partial [Actinostola sp. cb2023]